MINKKYEIKRDCLIYRDELEFKTMFHELYWRLLMKVKGCYVKELNKNK